MVAAPACNPRLNVGAGVVVDLFSATGFETVEVRLNPPLDPVVPCITGELDTPGGSIDGEVIALTSVVAEDV